MFIRGDWFFILLSLLTTAFMAKPYMYVLQQDNYRIKGIFKSKTIRSAYLVDLVAVLVFCGVYTLASFLHSRAFWGFIIAIFFYITEIVLYFVEDGEKKKPFKYTKRAVRGMGAITLVETAVTMILFFHLTEVLADNDTFFRYVAILIFPTIYPIIFMFTMWFVNIFEWANNCRYEHKTKKRLASANLIKIAITGSYGKTSVKNFLKELLDIKYKVLSTPESYNTPMGIAKTVNGLDISHQVFIAEMGARRVGDIKKLMKIIEPDIAVLTGINNQHLETFKTFDNIVDEKLQAVKKLKKSGKAYINGNLTSLIEKNIGDCSADNITYVGGRGNQVYASDIVLDKSGAKFNLHFGEQVYPTVSRLIGEHNVENLAVASAVAYALGVPPKHIVERIAMVEPVPHRLQLISAGAINIIDDTFNSNPDGAEKALKTLCCFSGRKVVVTPGLVELGDNEMTENINLGKKISGVADVVVLIGGKRSEYIKMGLGDFQGDVLHFQTLKDAQKSFKDFIRVGDTILLLNDLPDIYED
ncbi:MAG: UDP-N-acetylmuramoyl-tripeptide--D-alanyl-D-alanine ligase [Clostridia bacterium]|nr:UDP-N-acetylmuramoyl-tripeptide--D-alanyl-D-alanine ligase [Clostridia bacterium]